MSNFPVISWLNFAAFVQDMKIIEPGDHAFDKATADRIFLTVVSNVDKALQDILPPGQFMSRMLFYEALVRIAYFKYKITGHFPTTLEALKHFVEKVLLRKFDNYLWMGWR